MWVTGAALTLFLMSLLIAPDAAASPESGPTSQDTPTSPRLAGLQKRIEAGDNDALAGPPFRPCHDAREGERCRVASSRLVTPRGDFRAKVIALE